MSDKSPVHFPVLKKEVLNFLVQDNTEIFFDGTLGLGGHAEMILTVHSNLKFYAGTDLDIQHLEFAKERLKKWENKLVLANKNFSEIESVLRTIQKDGKIKNLSILLDLGLCSNQLDDETKGFAFMKDGKLNMAFDENQTKTAEVVVNDYEEKELTRIFREYGEERAAKSIAKSIATARAEKPLKTTFDLKSVIEKSVPERFLKKTLMRVFQAIRMEVNQELQHLERALESALNIMGEGSLIGVMSYHSLEDRMVKQFFKRKSTPITRESNYSLHEVVQEAEIKLITKKPITPTPTEIAENPRARSAKFRIAQKI